MDRNSFYLIFIPALAILAFLIGSAVAFIAMSGRIEPSDEDGSGQPAH